MPKVKTTTLTLSGRAFTLSYGMEEYLDLSARFETDIFRGSHWVSKFSIDTMEQILWTLMQRANPITLEELTQLWGPSDLTAINNALCELIVEEQQPSPLAATASAPTVASTSG